MNTLVIVLLSILFFILLVAVIVGSVIISNLLKKVDELEVQLNLTVDSAANKIQEMQNDVDGVYQHILSIHVSALSEIERLDMKGSFQSDDEIGFVFTNIKKVINQLKELLVDLRRE